MASHQQIYNAGETKGRTEVKTDILDILQQKVEEAKDKLASESGEAAMDKTSESGSYMSDKAGEEAKDNATQVVWDKTDETAEAKTSDSAEATNGKAESARDSPQAGKEKRGGVLQQTGEQIISMAQGAAAAVKHTFGIGEKY